MVEAPGIRVPAAEAESTRRRLRDLDVLRHDLKATRDGAHIVFPVIDSDAPRLDTRPFDFEPRDRRPDRYPDLLDWPDEEKEALPRAFEAMGDLAILKVPESLWDRRSEVGEALRRFTDARAVFHDHGVTGRFRTRDLERIAGEGGSRTEVAENGVRLWVDPAKAYFSPRLATERAAVVAQLEPGERVIDLFCGVAPLVVQAAWAGATAEGVEWNPDAVELARENLRRNRVEAVLHEGDAREVGPTLHPASHVVMNLPHGARQFLDVAAPLVAPGGVLHHHEIVEDEALAARREGLVQDLGALGRPASVRAVRHVRNYAQGVGHYAFDLELRGEP